MHLTEKNEGRELGNLELAKKGLKDVGEAKVIIEQDLRGKNTKGDVVDIVEFLVM